LKLHYEESITASLKISRKTPKARAKISGPQRRSTRTLGELLSVLILVTGLLSSLAGHFYEVASPVA
jgi:hypothetical protein